MRAFLYIRVSDEEQVKEGFSIEAQESLLRRKCTEWGFEIVAKPYIDDGYSAKNTKRPRFQQMMNDVETHHAQVIIFWRLDRFSRNSRDFQKVTETLDKKGCGIKSATENIDTTTAMGRFQLELTISLGQLERETTAERVKFVMEERHRKGLRNGATAPYGYKLVDGKLEIIPAEAEVVKRIYKDYLTPMSDTMIAKNLNQEVVHRREFSKWNSSTVNYILTNPVYCGHLRWNYRKLEGARTHQEIIVEGQHDAIITLKEFEHIQAVRKRRSIKREKVTSTYAFTGVVKCARCGYGMIGVRQKRTSSYTRYYRCLGRTNYGVCNMPHIKESTLTNEFLRALKNPDSDEFKKLITIEEPKPADKGQEKLERDLEQILKRRRKFQDAYANDLMTIEELKQRMQEEKAKEDLIRGMMEPAAEKEKSQWSHAEIVEILQSFSTLWDSIDDELAKKTFIQEAFSEIIINSPMERGKGGRHQNTPVEIVDWKLNT